MAIFKTILRTGLVVGTIGALGVGAMAVVNGPERTMAMLTTVQTHIQDSIDCHVDDPTALRAQLQDLQAEYPARIREVRADMAEISEEIRQLQREQAVSERVVQLADADLSELEPLLAEASLTNSLTSTVRFQDHLFTVGQAQRRAEEIRATRISYHNQGADASYSLQFLTEQADRLAGVLLELETEQAQFEAQLRTLDRQIDAIARNERLIDMMEGRQARIDELSRYEAQSLDHLVGRLNEVRTRQEATLEFLANGQDQQSYEDLARMQLDAQARSEQVELAPAHQLTAGN